MAKRRQGNIGFDMLKLVKCWYMYCSLFIVELNFEALNAEVLCSNNEFARSEAVGFNIDGSFYIATGVDHNHSIYRS